MKIGVTKTCFSLKVNKWVLEFSHPQSENIQPFD